VPRIERAAICRALMGRRAVGDEEGGGGGHAEMPERGLDVLFVGDSRTRQVRYR
jgi:hypothetical protein